MIMPHLYRFVVYSLVIIFLGLTIGLTWILNHPKDVMQQSTVLLPILYSTIISLFFLNCLVAYHLWARWKTYLKGERPKLHIHLALVFSASALIPAVVVAGFAAAFFQTGGVNEWFGTPVRRAIDGAKEVAQAYVKENKRAIEADAFRLIALLRPQMIGLLQDPELLRNLMNWASKEFNLEEVIIFDGQKNIVFRSYLTFAMVLEKILYKDFEYVKQNNEIVIHEHKDRVRALVRLDPLTDTYLFIGKIVDQKVLSYITHTEEASSAYELLANQQSGISFVFIVYFSLIVFLLLLGAAWGGLHLANRLFAPIDLLIQAAQQITLGHWDVHINAKPTNNEMDLLISSFNVMVEQLQKQKIEISRSQKQETWADIAQKIAHEIKNPLTPIQLSAERLKRRYSKQIHEGVQVFDDCISTIIRQVEQIQRLVNEFSAFARMPGPAMKKEDLVHFCSQVVQFYQQAHPAIAFSFKSNVKLIMFHFDTIQFNQVLSNLLQNSINALVECKNLTEKPLIQVIIKKHSDKITIEFKDNGPGFLQEHISRLLEPYYTTREKGTGLGLAIVSKIIGDHNGAIYFRNNPSGGAKTELVFLKTETLSIQQEDVR